MCDARRDIIQYDRGQSISNTFARRSHRNGLSTRKCILWGQSRGESRERARSWWPFSVNRPYYNLNHPRRRRRSLNRQRSERRRSRSRCCPQRVRYTTRAHTHKSTPLPGSSLIRGRQPRVKPACTYIRYNHEHENVSFHFSDPCLLQSPTPCTYSAQELGYSPVHSIAIIITCVYRIFCFNFSSISVDRQFGFC